MVGLRQGAVVPNALMLFCVHRVAAVLDCAEVLHT